MLEDKGVKPSIQRIQIFRCLMESKNHPTAKDIYERISKKIPTLSKTTVYNTVKLFEDKGILRPIRIKEGEARYDIRVGFHPHFSCKRCGSLYDLDDKLLVKEEKEIDGHLIEGKCVCYLGVCRNCRRKREH